MSNYDLWREQRQQEGPDYCQHGMDSRCPECEVIRLQEDVNRLQDDIEQILAGTLVRSPATSARSSPITDMTQRWLRRLRGTSSTSILMFYKETIMGKFGWSYPAGCSGPPDDDRPMHPRAKEALVILDGRIGKKQRQKLVELLTGLSDDLYYELHRECPACLKRMGEEIIEENRRLGL